MFLGHGILYDTCKAIDDRADNSGSRSTGAWDMQVTVHCMMTGSVT